MLEAGDNKGHKGPRRPGHGAGPGASVRRPDQPARPAFRAACCLPVTASILDRSIHCALGTDCCFRLLAEAGDGMILGMERDRTAQATLDLFSTAASFGQPSPPPRATQSSAQKRRHVLPKDLPNAVKHLDDRELDRLIAVLLQEAKRRGKLLQTVHPNAPDQSVRRRSSPADKSSQRRQADVATVSLTHGQVNAVRAAAKAGIKPSVIARQFGISQSDVRKVLTSPTG